MAWLVYAKIDVRGWADEAVPEEQRLFYSHWRGPYENKNEAIEVAQKCNANTNYNYAVYGLIESKLKTVHKTIYPLSSKKVKVGQFQEV